MNSLKHQIDEILKDKNLNADALSLNNKESLIEKLSVYHEELYYQNDELKRINIELERQKNEFESLFQNAPICYVVLDEQQNIVKFNALFNKHFTQQSLHNHSITPFIHPDSQDHYYFLMRNVLKRDDIQTTTLSFNAADGKRTFKVSALKYSDDNQLRIRMSLIDVTDEVHYQVRNEFLSFHDQLTGLYNRRFFEEELLRLNTYRNLPLGIIMADVDGLKLVNDAFGHSTGDKLLIQTAEVLKQHCRQDDIIARIGGDEFMILVPRTSVQAMNDFIVRLKTHTEQIFVEDLTLSVSYGYCIKESVEIDIHQTIKRAEDAMYSNKLIVQTSQKRKIIEGILSSLHEKHSSEEVHSNRVSGYAKALGQAIGLDDNRISNLILAGLLHDIGKVAIDYSLLEQPRPLTTEEYAEVKKHPEIGYRILHSSGLFSEISSAILSHHERVDGLGYPRGLTAEHISIESKILAICDAYDAMTTDRPYRKALSKENAIYELTKNAGTQFDSTLVEMFVQQVII